MSSFRRPAIVALVAALTACSRAATAPPFALRSDHAAQWALSEQRGRPVLLTFGFTHCADTCPETIAKLVAVRQALGPRGAGVEIVMITVDPRRDTPAALHAFVSRFAGPVVGLTGSPRQIRDVEAAYHVWAQPIPGTRGKAAYDVAHTAAIYMIDASGRISALRDDNDSLAALEDAAREMLG